MGTPPCSARRALSTSSSASGAELAPRLGRKPLNTQRPLFKQKREHSMRARQETKRLSLRTQSSLRLHERSSPRLVESSRRFCGSTRSTERLLMIIRVESVDMWEYRVARKVLLRQEEHCVEQTARAARQLRAAEGRLNLVRRSLEALDKKHPQPTAEIPF